jgi:putative FmdB family regulatory protein
MPITRYTCQSCGNEFAKIYFTPEGAPKRCPACSSEDFLENGDAFVVDPEVAARTLCVSCESCGGEDSTCVPVST